MHSADTLQRLVYATRIGGITHLITALRAALGTEVALIDGEGSVLAASPTKIVWEPEAIRLALTHPRALGTAMQVRAIDINGTPVVTLLIRADSPPRELIDTAADLIAIELSRLLTAQQERHRITADLIGDVLSGQLSERDALSRLSIVGVDPTQPFRVLVGWTQADTPASEKLPFDSIFALMSGGSAPFLRVPVDPNILMVIPEDPMVTRVADNLYHQLQEPGVPAGVGISRPHTGGSGFRTAYFEALQATTSGSGVQLPGSFELSRLLLLSNTALPLPEVARQQLMPLIQHDHYHSSELLSTLRVYLDADRNTATTCERLFIHRNTLRYRLAQISRQLDVDIHATATITSLWLACLALDGHSTTIEEDTQ